MTEARASSSTEGTGTVRVTTTSGTTYNFAYASVGFGTRFDAIPNTFQSLSLCSSDGAVLTLGKSKIAQIVGPAQMSSEQNCCPSGERLEIQTKSGQTLSAIVKNTCGTNAYGQLHLSIYGKDEATGGKVVLKMRDVSQVEFP